MAITVTEDSCGATYSKNWMPAVFRNELEFSGIKCKVIIMGACSGKVGSHQLGKPGKADAAVSPMAG